MTTAPAVSSATMLLAGFASGSLSPVTVAESLLASADTARTRYRHIVSIDRAAVRAAAEDSELRWRQGSARPLEGLPFALKGVMPADSSLVRRVTDAGAYLQCIVVPSDYGTPIHFAPATEPLNPTDITRTAGGSSTGSAIALAAGHAPLAIGSDAAGSIRIPAACCKVIGFKPTRGTLPKAGGVGLSPTLGEAGPMARSMTDLALLFRAMNYSEAGSAETPVRLCALLDHELDADAARAFSSVLRSLEAIGTHLYPSTLPGLAEARAAGWVVLCYEAAIAMAPYIETIRGAPTTFLKYADRGRLISRETYTAALADGERFASRVDAALETVEALITPCAPFATPRADDPALPEKARQMGEMFLPFSLSGHPALVLPLRHAGGRVTPIQLVGRKGGDAVLLACAERIEHAIAMRT